MNQKMHERVEDIKKLAAAAGLKPYDVHFFTVPSRYITTVASYGLPTRYSHWSFGRTFRSQQQEAEMGSSKIYELILNNNPSYAFLDQSNSDTANLLIVAHCLAHSCFFANNYLFVQNGETNMIDVAKQHAKMIEEFKEEHGNDTIDDWLDIALSMERNIDLNKGQERIPYPKPHTEYKERKTSPWEKISSASSDPLLKKVHAGNYLPPEPERDLLWFLANYAHLESWQRRIFEMVRRESFYFFPQFRTKIMNEGWASYWHAELMRQYSYGDDNEYGVKGIIHPLTPEEHLDFVSLHEKVVQPGLKIKLKVEVPELDPLGRPTGRMRKIFNPKLSQYPDVLSHAIRINPYYVGFRIFRDIKERWDEYFKQGYREDEFGRKIPVTISGDQKIMEVREMEDDVSFIRNYLTEKLCQELHLFSYGNNDKYKDDYRVQENEQDENASEDEGVVEQTIENQTIIVQSKNVKNVIDNFAKQSSNYGSPLIVIRRVDADGVLRLEHLQHDEINLDLKYTKEVMKGIHKVWKRPIELIRKDGKKTWVLTYSGSFEVSWESADYPEVLENSAAPSSW